MNWRNYDEVISLLISHEFELSRLDVGGMRRVKRTGHKQRGWYSLHEITLDNNESALIGSFGYFIGGESFKEKIGPGEGAKLSKDQLAAIKAQHAEATRKAEAMRKRDAELAAKEAQRVWSAYVGIGTSDYLTRKGVQAHGLRFAPSGVGTVAIPMQDVHGITHGLQIIRGKNRPKNKMEKEYFPKGLSKKGHFYLFGGIPKNILLIAEGYATAATLHEATGYPIAVAFDAGNLMPVALALHKKYPRTKILVCADDDYLSDGNPGCAAAESAAVAVGGSWVRPIFPFEREGKKLTDFNDLANFHNCSLSSVKVQIEDKLNQLGWGSAPASAGRSTQGGGGDNKGTLKPLLDVSEAVRRYSLIYGAGGTMYDHQEASLIPKSDVLDICVDHAWREWKLHPDRSVVRLSEVGFDPTERDGHIVCNLWGGWPTKPKAGQCETLLSLLRHLCSGEEKGNDAIYQWVLKWLAYPIQHQGAKMRTALIFHGPQGAGKNLFFEAYAAIFGKYARIIGQAEIDDKFNDWASGKLFMIADEVVARQELFHIKNKIKALITGETIRINPKNVAAHDERNHVNLVFLSNEKQPLVLEQDDRRFVVIWTPHKLGENYYSDVAEEVANGGIDALYDYLQQLPLGDFNEHSKPPMTQSKVDLIDINLESTERFMRDWLDGGLDLPVCPALSEDIYSAYKKFCDKNGVARPRELNQLIGGIVKMEGWRRDKPRVFDNYNHAGTPRQRAVIFPPNSLVSEKQKFTADLTISQWVTNCVLDFYNAIKGEDYPRGDDHA